MKKIYIVLIFILCILFFSTPFEIFAQPPMEGDCDPNEKDPANPNYCFNQIPIDDNVTFLILAALGFGLWSIREEKLYNRGLTKLH